MSLSIRIVIAMLLFLVATNKAAQSDEASLELKDLNGQPRRLTDFRGKIIVLNFWATWCVPCREEMPMLVALQKRYEARGVQVLAPSADEESTQKAIPEFIRKAKINFPIWIGATTADMKRLGLGEALPATAIIDRDGKIVGRLLGPLEKEDLVRRIEYLLGDRQAAAPEPLVNNIEKADHNHKDDEHHHGHEGEEEHEHGGVGVEGASTVPS
jgi:thiol-disulfide isomerase/thioredoxin